MKIVPAGALLLAMYGATVGRLATLGVAATTNQAVCHIVPDRSIADVRYLFYALRFSVPSLLQRRVGGAQPNISQGIIQDLQVSLPALPEQRRIAEILDKADALRAKRRAALAQLDTLTQSIFLDMFGDPAINPRVWPVKALAQLCSQGDDIRCGPFGTQLAQSEFRTEGVPLWGIRHVNAVFERPTDEFVDVRTARRLRQYSIEPDDIVMTRKGTIGNCAVYPDHFPGGIMHSDLLRVRLSRQLSEPLFLAHQLQYSRDVERQLALISGGAVMPGVNVTKLKNLQVIVPPLSIQCSFTRRVVAVEKLKTSHRASLSGLNVLFSSLQHRAFRGDL